MCRRTCRPQLGSEKVESYLNQLNQHLLTAVEKSGEAFLSNALVGGKFVLRACIVNFHTALGDIEALPLLLSRLGQEADSPSGGRARRPDCRTGAAERLRRAAPYRGKRPSGARRVHHECEAPRRKRDHCLEDSSHRPRGAGLPANSRGSRRRAGPDHAAADAIQPPAGTGLPANPGRQGAGVALAIWNRQRLRSRATMSLEWFQARSESR